MLYIVIGCAILLLIIVYAIIERWYKRRYEDHLFSNKTNLYNLMIYINNMKKQGAGDDEIIERLKQAKWNSEQIRYAMRKYAGKRTGMFPLTTFFSKDHTKFNKPSE